MCSVLNVFAIRFTMMTIQHTLVGVEPLNVKTTLNVKTAECEKTTNR